MLSDFIFIKGAREHNLKSIDVAIPRDKLVVITGVSGSGKSSLAFDTIYAEGQRRYLESLSAYARQFLGRMEKPDVDYIEGLSPAISIDQKGPLHNPRSTVGTVTEIYDYLRLLFSRVGHAHCPHCGRQVSRLTPQQITDAIIQLPHGSRILILSPVVKDRKGEYQALFEDLGKSGYARVRADGEVYELTEKIELDRNKKHSIEVVIDRLVISENLSQSRVFDSVETSLKLSRGSVIAFDCESGQSIMFSEEFACPLCGISIGELAPRNFSFNSPHGACPRCGGLGVKQEFSPELILDLDFSLAQGAIRPFSGCGWWVEKLRYSGFPIYTRLRDLSPSKIDEVLYGGVRFEGIIPYLGRRYKDTDSEELRQEIERHMCSSPCPECGGRRLKPESLAVTIDDKNIMDVCALNIAQARAWVDRMSPKLSPKEMVIAKGILKEFKSRLDFLLDVGLDYLTLDRSSTTLSGGEAQRIRLATQIGSGLMGVIYILDEPTVGLHPADDRRLISTLKKLRDLGNSIICVEHDEAMMRSADHVIDMGPGAGEKGGWVVAQGGIEEICQSKSSLTGKYLTGEKTIPFPKLRRRGKEVELVIRGARENNLKNIEAHFPLGVFICITGVSGSGKSTLVGEILYKGLSQLLYHSGDRPGDHDAILGAENIDKVVNIDQSPIGRTPRSNPATYTGTFTPIRELFSLLPEARVRGYKPGRFSFNVRGGRCEACQGGGLIQIEMQFLPSVCVPCEVCQGKRYNREVLQVRFKEHNIADILDMSVDEALALFESFPHIKAKLSTLHDVGLGYIKLGQPATTLSGGEAQRVKLATELSRRPTGKTLYILDEPTTGLSFEDISFLIKVLQRLVDQGNTVIVIEHHLDVVKNADFIIDLGPGAGDKGGWIVAQGTPEEIACNASSLTGSYLTRVLRGGREPVKSKTATL
jgi:excinuclease ABC subunit A